MVYAGAFIARTSFTIGGRRFFALFEDAMISMRYARNLVDGHGLVWNPGGERVEGFSNPLWTLLMAAVQLLDRDEARVSLWIQVAGALSLLATIGAVHGLARSLGASWRAAAAAAALTAFYLPLCNWAFQGMEVGVLALAATGGTWLALRSLREPKLELRVYLLLALATLVRLDFLCVYLVILAVVAWCTRARGVAAWWPGLAIAAGCLLVQASARWLYFGELLPNTYHLKLTGYPLLERLSWGALAAWSFAAKAGLPVLLVGTFLALRERADERAVLPAAVFAGQLAYSIWVGGDAWEGWGANRYLCIAMPGLFALTAMAIDRLVVGLETYGRPLGSRDGVFAAAVLACAVAFNAVDARHPMRAWLLLDAPPDVEANRSQARLALILRQVMQPRATLAAARVGTLGYFARRPVLDMLGKSDRHVARLPMRRMPFWPGHLKWDYGYTIGRLQPDVVAELWLHEAEAAPFLKSAYQKWTLEGVDLYLLRASRQLRWDRLEGLGSAPTDER